MWRRETTSVKYGYQEREFCRSERDRRSQLVIRRNGTKWDPPHRSGRVGGEDNTRPDWRRWHQAVIGRVHTEWMVRDTGSLRFKRLSKGSRVSGEGGYSPLWVSGESCLLGIRTGSEKTSDLYLLTVLYSWSFRTGPPECREQSFLPWP